jgi:hypothetical protein
MIIDRLLCCGYVNMTRSSDFGMVNVLRGADAGSLGPRYTELADTYFIMEDIDGI